MAKKKTDKKKTAVRKKTQAKQPEKALSVVGIGSSAGGLEALEILLKNMPSSTGLAFVIVPHLDPKHKSILPEILQRYTKMAVCQVTDGLTVEPDRVYIIPPNKDMAIMNGALHLMVPQIHQGLRHPIDFFFRSLAQACEIA